MTTSNVSESSSGTVTRVLKYIWRDYSIVIALICIVIVAGLIEPRFAAPGNLLLIMRQASVIGMIALGMTFVIITGGIDLSAGHVLASAGTVLILLQGMDDMPLIAAILACLAVSTSIGFMNGCIITKFKVPPFIVTLAVGTLLRSVAMFLLGGLSVSGRAVPEFTRIGTGTIGPIPFPLIVWISSAFILGFVLNYTKFGSYIFAVGGNENAARYSGIKTNQIKVAAYTLTGFCIGIATVLDLSRTAAVSAATSGLLFEFDAITAVVIGGTALSGGRGRIMGTFFGMIIIGLVSNLIIMIGFSPFLSGAVKGTIILGAVLLQRRDQ